MRLLESSPGLGARAIGNFNVAPLFLGSAFLAGIGLYFSFRLLLQRDFVIEVRDGGEPLIERSMAMPEVLENVAVEDG